MARFIPTCVGNTLPLEAGWSRQSVHPHVRGEYLNRASMARADHGSSPRAWGIRKALVVIDAHERFIPTCVGNTDSYA